MVKKQNPRAKHSKFGIYIPSANRGEKMKYMSRLQATRRLGLSLPVFRKLAIMKGVVPHAPPNSIKNKNRIYYLRKDIRFLEMDPILNTFKEQIVRRTKARRAKTKKETLKLKWYNKNWKDVAFKLDHIVKEKYPTFSDALRDMDDALSMIAMYAITRRMKSAGGSAIIKCAKINRNWMAYVMATGSLDKVFVSVRGMYYQAVVQGEKITWLAPLEFHGKFPEKGVNANIMKSFLGLYIQTLNFVLFKLYADLGVAYPPADQSDGALEILEEKYAEKTKGQKSSRPHAKLFEGLTFYLSREVPRTPLYFVLRCFGARVLYDDDGTDNKRADESINYEVVDREAAQLNRHIFFNRVRVQPQWVFDSVNERLLLDTDQYAPGKECPPHLSPFTDDAATGYVPERRKELNRLREAAVASGKVPEQVVDDDEDEQDFQTDIVGRMEEANENDLRVELGLPPAPSREKARRAAESVGEKDQVFDATRRETRKVGAQVAAHKQHVQDQEADEEPLVASEETIKQNNQWALLYGATAKDSDYRGAAHKVPIAVADKLNILEAPLEFASLVGKIHPEDFEHITDPVEREKAMRQAKKKKELEDQVLTVVKGKRKRLIQEHKRKEAEEEYQRVALREKAKKFASGEFKVNPTTNRVDYQHAKKVKKTREVEERKDARKEKTVAEKRQKQRDKKTKEAQEKEAKKQQDLPAF